MAYVLWLHHAHGVRVRLSPVRADLTSEAAVFRAYLHQMDAVKRAHPPSPTAPPHPDLAP